MQRMGAEALVGGKAADESGWERRLWWEGRWRIEGEAVEGRPERALVRVERTGMGRREIYLEIKGEK
jgi:hypothetical protein